MFSPNATTNAIVNLPNGVRDITAYYANVSVSHQVNNWFSHSLSAGRQLQLGITANLADLYSLNYQANWYFVRNLNITTQFLYQHGTTYNGVPQTLDIYGGGAALGYNVTRRLTAALSYFLQIKNANPSTLNYTQNRLVFDFRYSF
jgi:hypothetical protein